MAYRCLNCDCIHGWEKNERVKLVTEHVRYPGEDVWWCPNCGKEHRTTDGTWFGQTHKMYEPVDLDSLPEHYGSCSYFNGRFWSDYERSR